MDNALNITYLVIIELQIGHIISEARFSCVLSCVSPFYKLPSIYLHFTSLFPETSWRDFWYFSRLLGFWVSEIFIKIFFFYFLGEKSYLLRDDEVRLIKNWLFSSNSVKEYNQMNVFLPVYFTCTYTRANDLFNIAKLSHVFFRLNIGFCFYLVKLFTFKCEQQNLLFFTNIGEILSSWKYSET